MNYNLERGSIQEGFYNSRAKIQIFGGGFGNGKTTALVIKTLRIAQDYPGANVLLARSTYPRLNDTLRKVFFLWCPKAWIRKMPTIDDNTCYLNNGTIINFRYIAQRGKQSADGSTTSNLLSAQYDFIGVDQIEDPEITEKDFYDLLGRLRGNTPYRPGEEGEDKTMPSTGPRMLAMTCNPTHNWVYKVLVQPYIIWRDRGIKTDKLMVDGATGLPILELFEGSTYTNKNLPADFISGLESTYRGQMRDRFLLGKWAAFEGLVYPDFDQRIHMITRAQAEGYMLQCRARHVRLEAIEGYDFGISSPSCYLFGFRDDFGRVILLDGYHQANFPYPQQCTRIHEIRGKYYDSVKVNDPIYADPSLFRRVTVAEYKNTGVNLGNLFRDYGIYMVPGSNDILNGVAKVTSYLNGTDYAPHIVTGEAPGPLLYVCADLDYVMDEFFSYYWRRNPQGQVVDDPIDGNDHAMDTIKYMLSKLPEASELRVPKSALPPGYMFWQERDNAESERV